MGCFSHENRRVRHSRPNRTTFLTMFDLTPFPASCPGCQQPCEAVLFGKSPRRAGIRKDECLSVWREITPEEFQRPIQPELLSAALLPALDTDGLSGVGLIGANGAGKTRVAYALLKKASSAGKKCFAITA